MTSLVWAGTSRLVERDSWSLPEMREQDCYGGNTHGYVRGRVSLEPVGQGFRKGVRWVMPLILALLV